LGKGLTTLYHEKQLVTKCYTRPQNWTEFLEQSRPWKY